ncbi:MAG TPA: cytochrome c peroxidase [Polyangiaceae bacterium]|nr:cytochrome c peroxidase [Polyangiaceae bacterium]
MSGWLRWLACGLCVACSVSSEEPNTSVGGSSGQPSVVGGANAGGGSGPQAGSTAAEAGHAGQDAAMGGEPAAAGDAATGGDASPTSGSAGTSAQAGSGPDVITGLEPTAPYPDSFYPPENPYSPEKTLLGKILFWEEQLSSRDTHACGTCHQPGAGGSDPRAASSLLGAGPNGVFGDDDDARGSGGVVRCDSAGAAKADPVYGLNVQLTPRKTPSSLDAWFFDELFWDGRARSSFVDPVTGTVAIEAGGALESQAAGPPVSSSEMSCEGYGWTDIESKIAAATPLKLASQIPQALAEAIGLHPTYPSLFEWAYGSPEVTARRILFAIATYERQLRSDQTPWDRFNAGDADALTADQQAGLAVFNVKARCSTCHAAPLFTDNKFHNIGAQVSELDPGRSAISGDQADLGKMKTPSLRNVGLRAAGGLLHFGTGDGATLRSVLGVYRQGGTHHEHTDPEIRPLNMPDYEFEQLLDFVQNGLTDARAAAELPPFDRPRLGSER